LFFAQECARGADLSERFDSQNKTLTAANR